MSPNRPSKARRERLSAQAKQAVDVRRAISLKRSTGPRRPAKVMGAHPGNASAVFECRKCSDAIAATVVDGIDESMSIITVPNRRIEEHGEGKAGIDHIDRADTA